MSGTVRLEKLIEKAHVKCREFDGGKKLQAFGVSNTNGVTRTAHRKSDDLGEYLVIEPGSFAYNPYRINVGSIGLTPASVTGVVSPAYVVFRVKEKKLVPEVLLDFLKSPEGLRQINKLASGAVRKALRYEDICEIEFPDISYERQLEILQHKQGFNKQHGSLLAEISHQETLLAMLQQAILQEAIQGKLTADWRAAHPQAEPATQLLHCIQAEKARLVAAKQLRPEKPLPKITPEEIPFEIPKTWEWCRISNATLVIVDCPHSTPQWTDSGMNCAKTNQFNRFHLDLSQRYYVSKQTYKERVERLVPKPGDVLYSREGSILGIACRIPNGEELCLGQRMMLLRPHHPTTAAFLELMLNSPHVTKIADESTLGGCSPHINVGEIKSFVIPLPPLAEQEAIEARVEALMTTCRALEKEIIQTRTHASHLLQAVLKEAFAPAAERGRLTPATLAVSFNGAFQ